jgi:hypothetical protein
VKWCVNGHPLKAKMADLLLHEILHHCVGGHFSPGKTEPDNCDRPDAVSLAADFAGNCGQVAAW